MEKDQDKTLFEANPELLDKLHLLREQARKLGLIVPNTFP